MKKRTYHIAAVLLATMLVSVKTEGAAFAQAGSTGGTIGNQDKSVSGGGDQTPSGKESHVRHRSSAGTRAPLSISGKWAWTAKCGDGSDWAGSFDFTQNSDGTVSGAVTGSDGSGSISGRLVGNTLTGSRAYSAHSTQIVLTFAAGGNSLQGSEESRSHGICRYRATRS
jgi:hypothetical protein